MSNDAFESAQPLDASAERARIAETLLSSAARLIGGRSELEIVRGVCDALVQISPHLRLVWTWFGPSKTDALSPQVYAGPAADYARRLHLQRTLLTQIGPAFRIIDGRPAEAFSVSQWSLFGPWRQAAREHGVRNVLALPLQSRFTGYSGIFVLYADTPDYFEQVGQSLFASLAALFSSVLTVSAERVELERTAHHDALTGMLNRHATPLLERRVHRGSLFDPPACVLLLDLDHFKAVNDVHGHGMGDRVLQACAEVIKQALRRGDDVVRWGGEEFLVCLPHTHLADAHKVAEKLRAAVAQLRDPLPITVSIGVAELQPQDAFAIAVEAADAALMRAKQEGRDRVCISPSPPPSPVSSHAPASTPSSAPAPVQPPSPSGSPSRA